MLGLISPNAHFALQPPLVSDGDFSGAPVGCNSCTLAEEPTPEESRRARERAYAVISFALALTGVGVGAYVGAKKSREWSAGGSVIGLASASVVALLFKAAILPERVK